MIGIISDIHGNYEALKAVLGKLDEMNIKNIFCLGDVVGYYTQVNECCEELIKRSIPSLMGNHDWYMAGGGFCPRSRSVNDCLIYQRRVITKKNLEWIKTFPLQKEFEGIKMVHGGWSDAIDEYLLEPTEAYFSKMEGQVFVSGHTHLPRIDYFGNRIYCNPGSVGQPRDGDNRASFAIYDGSFQIQRVAYDRQSVYSRMEKAGFNDYYYGCLETGARTLCKLERQNS